MSILLEVDSMLQKQQIPILPAQLDNKLQECTVVLLINDAFHVLPRILLSLHSEETVSFHSFLYCNY